MVITLRKIGIIAAVVAPIAGVLPLFFDAESLSENIKNDQKVHVGDVTGDNSMIGVQNSNIKINEDYITQESKNDLDLSKKNCDAFNYELKNGNLNLEYIDGMLLNKKTLGILALSFETPEYVAITRSQNDIIRTSLSLSKETKLKGDLDFLTQKRDYSNADKVYAEVHAHKAKRPEHDLSSPSAKALLKATSALCSVIQTVSI